MATYLMLFRFTEKGIQSLKKSPDRVEALKQTFRNRGAEVKDFYALMGKYDTMFLAEAPDDETIVRLAAEIGAEGYVRAETYRAFNMDEYRKIVAGL